MVWKSESVVYMFMHFTTIPQMNIQDNKLA